MRRPASSRVSGAGRVDCTGRRRTTNTLWPRRLDRPAVFRRRTKRMPSAPEQPDRRALPRTDPIHRRRHDAIFDLARQAERHDPLTAQHLQRMGELIVSILLLQDMLAIAQLDTAISTSDEADTALIELEEYLKVGTLLILTLLGTASDRRTELAE